MMKRDSEIKSKVTKPLKKLRLVACIPSYNEQETIGSVVQKTMQHVEKVYVVDDASTDKTVDQAKAHGAYVIRHDQRKGLGQTIHELIEVSIKDNPDIIVILEGDNLLYPEIVPDFVEPALSGEADVVFGLVREISSNLGEGDDEQAEFVESEDTGQVNTLALRVLSLSAAKKFLAIDNSVMGELEPEFDFAKKSGLRTSALIIEVDSDDSATSQENEAIKEIPELVAETPEVVLQPPEVVNVTEVIQSSTTPEISNAEKSTGLSGQGLRILGALAIIAVLAGAFLIFNSGFVSKPDYILQIQAPEGSGSMSMEAGSYSISQGNSSRIEAIPALGWSFDYWIINNSTRNYSNPITIALDGNESLRAKFSQVKYVLTVGCVGFGSTTPSVGAYACEFNSTVQVIVTPAFGYRLVDWTLDGASVIGGDSYSVDMDSDHMLVAVLSPLPCVVDVEILGNGSVTKTPYYATYPYGSDVILTTTPNEGWNFKGWSGDVSGSNDTVRVSVKGNMSITAEFTQIPTQEEGNILTIEFPEGQGMTNPLAGAYAFTNGSIVEVNAVADEEWIFDHWLLDDWYADYTNPITMIMSTNHKIKPIFMNVGPSPTNQTYPLLVNIVGSGSGSITLSPVGGTYAAGTVVTLTAVPAANSTFTTWGGVLSGTLNPVTITMDSTKSVTADFTLTLCTVSLVQVGQGTATITPLGQCVYGSTIDLTAVESVSGWVFTGWSSDPSIMISNPLNLSTTATVHGSGSVTATFTPIMYSLSVSTLGTGSGSVVLSPAGGSYASGTVVTLESVPAAGSTFTLWGGDLSGSTNPTTITMDSGKSVTAEFTLIEYTISVSASPGGTVSVSPLQATYHYGDSVTLTANPDTGYSFTNWSGGISGSANPYILSVAGNISATAIFNLD